MKERFDIVYHLAAQIDVRKSVLNPAEDAKINILDTLNLLELCKEFKIKHFIFSSKTCNYYKNLIINCYFVPEIPIILIIFKNLNFFFLIL